jgi:hypothetical protein
VLGTAAVSIAFHLVGVDWLSVFLFVLACVLWLPLALVFVARVVRHPWHSLYGTGPALAATALLAVRCSLQGWQSVAAVVLLEAAVLWAVLLARGLLVGALPATAATQVLALLTATLGGALGSRWLLWPAVSVLCLGLLLHGYALARAFGARQLLGNLGEQWLTCGVLALAATVSAESATLAGHEALRVVGEVLLGLAVAWYVVLLGCEALWPRLSYDVQRWATVFAMGMTAVAALTTGAGTLGRTLLWPAIAVWALVAMGAARQSVRRPEAGRGRMGP